MSTNMNAPKETFFVSESIASTVDMSQFDTGEEENDILDAAMIGTIVAGSTVISVPLTICKFGGEDHLAIAGVVDSSFDPTKILTGIIDRVEVKFPNGKNHVMDTSQLNPIVCIQPTGTNFLLTINFEKKDLLIKG